MMGSMQGSAESPSGAGWAGPWGRELAALLLDQQMWCWGQDVRCAPDNLLLRYGFRRERSPAARGSAYFLSPSAGAELVLWGFGLFYGEGGAGGLFLERRDFRPVWTAHRRLPSVVWEPCQLRELLTPWQPPSGEDVRLLAAVARWVAAYESWVQEAAGVEYRRACVREWERAVVAAEEMPSRWQDLARAAPSLLAAPA